MSMLTWIEHAVHGLAHRVRGRVLMSLMAGVTGMAGLTAPSEPAPAEPSAPAPVTIDPAVFAHDDVHGSSNETFTVIGGDAALVTGALERAAARFMRVDETGTEHPDDATAQACLEQGRYTANYVSDPEPTARGPQVHVDCKGVIPAEMARTFHRILREELQHVLLERARATRRMAARYRQARAWNPTRSFGLRLQPVLDAMDAAEFEGLLGVLQSAEPRLAARFGSREQLARDASLYAKKLAGRAYVERYWLLLPPRDEGGLVSVAAGADAP